MKISPKILSIPPYLSTTWKNIASLHVREEGTGFRLIVILQNRATVEVPGLDKESVDAIFDAHAKYAEAESSAQTSPLDGPFSLSLPLRPDGQTIDSLGASMQHSPDQSDLPPLPPEVLEKITMVAKAFGLEDSSALPKAEESCNCVYCQVVRALRGDSAAHPEEEVADADLKFRNWDISQTAEKLYHVTNPLDQTEHYDVFLGDPLGCTCGHKNCEHIRAVLNT
jgi:hypothetical protein